jgi:hypothetical protein
MLVETRECLGRNRVRRCICRHDETSDRYVASLCRTIPADDRTQFSPGYSFSSRHNWANNDRSRLMAASAVRTISALVPTIRMILMAISSRVSL